MQIEIGIALILIVFFVPIVAYVAYRRIKARRLMRLYLKNGEIFDKENERVGIVEEGR